MREEQNILCEECELHGISIFRHLSKEDIDNISSEKVASLYKKGQVVFYERNHPNGLYCIQYGKVKVYKIGEGGKEQIVRLASAGDILGYRALLADEPYVASAETLDKSCLCFIPKHVFIKLLESDKKFNNSVMQLLSRDLREAEQKITNLAHKHVKERLAGALLLLKEKYGLEEDGSTLRLTMTRENLASLVGTATESVIRHLQELKNDRIIKLNKRKIKILDYKGLMEVARIYE